MVECRWYTFYNLWHTHMPTCPHKQRLLNLFKKFFIYWMSQYIYHSSTMIFEVNPFGLENGCDDIEEFCFFHFAIKFFKNRFFYPRINQLWMDADIAWMNTSLIRNAFHLKLNQKILLRVFSWNIWLNVGFLRLFNVIYIRCDILWTRETNLNNSKKHRKLFLFLSPFNNNNAIYTYNFYLWCHVAMYITELRHIDLGNLEK